MPDSADGPVAHPPSPSEPELVQLLTPEGERVEHPDYAVDLTDEELRGLYRDLVLVRRIDAEATALQRQGELGIWAVAARPGGRAGRLRPGDARRTTTRSRPTASTASPGAAASTRCNLLGLFRGVEPRRLGPGREELPPLHDRHRRADAARHRLRDGHAEGRRRRRGHRLLRRRRDQPGRRQRGVHLRQRLQRAGRLLLPEQPVGDLRAARAADAASRSTSGRRASASPASGSTATTCSPCYAVTRAALQNAPRGQRPDADRGLHLPDGRAHDVRRPDPLPARRRARGVEAQGPDRAGARPTWSAPASPTRTSSTRSRRRPTSSPRTCARAASRCRTRSRCRSSTTSTPSRTPLVDEERDAFAAYLDGFDASRREH